MIEKEVLSFLFESILQFNYVLVMIVSMTGSFCILTICNFISRFGFEGSLWVLITSVPDLCMLFTCIH